MHGRKTTDRTAALLPPCFFAPAVAFFATALVLAPAVAPDLRTHFYQPHVLALVHMLTLGWISMVMMGVLYRYVPGLTKRPVPFPRLAVAQWASFVAGTTALIGGFWTGSWPTATAAAGTLATSAVLLCANLWPMLRAARRLGVAELGVGLATTALVAAAILGTLLAADKQRGFLGGDVVTNLAAHAHLAALGWVGLTVCALSFRFLPAFSPPRCSRSSPRSGGGAPLRPSLRSPSQPRLRPMRRSPHGWCAPTACRSTGRRDTRSRASGGASSRPQPAWCSACSAGRASTACTSPRHTAPWGSSAGSRIS